MRNPQKRIYAFWKALLFGAAFFGISYLLGFCWETNDDTGIAYALSRLSNNYTPFQWRFLSRIIHKMYERFPIVDWWAVNSVFAVSISAFVYAYVIHQRYPTVYGVLISTSVLILLWLVAFYRINFTRTAGVVAIAGILLIANGLFPAPAYKRSLVEYAFGCVLLLYGASIRSSCALLALAFLAVIGLIMLVRDKFSFKWKWFRTHLLQMCLLCLTVGLYFGASALNAAQLTPQQKEYLEYNNLRASINDYVDNYPSFEDASEEYLDAGWNDLARSAFFNWLSEDTSVFTMESMEQIRELREPSQDYTLLSNLTKRNPEIVSFAVMILLLLCCFHKHNWIYGLSALAMLLLLCLYLVLQGRLPARVYQPVMLGMICTVAFLCGREGMPIQVPPEASGPGINLFYMRKVWAMLLVTGLILNLIPGVSVMRSYYQNSKDDRSLELQQEIAEKNRAVLDVIDEDPSHVYIFDIQENPADMSEAFTFWEMRPMEYCENRFSLGGWTARNPYRVAQLVNYGITNPMTALIENPSVYSTYSSRLLKYLRSYYDPAISVSGTKTFDDIQFVQYTASVDDALLVSDPEKTVLIEDFHFSDAHSSGTWDFAATISDEAPHERVFYCNITNKDVRYTYRLKCEGNTLSGTFYNLREHYDADLSQFRIFEKTAEGYIEYTKIGTGDNPIKIIKQPKDVKQPKGFVFDIKVAAQGDGLTYRWYYKDKDDSDFTYTSSFKSNTYSVEMTPVRDGRQVYCVITDRYGCSVQSKTVTMRLA